MSEYLVERLIRGGASKLCFVIAPGKSDILEYYGGSSLGDVSLAFVVQPQPAGLCDAVFHALPLISPDECVMIGLPDTVWFPEDALLTLPNASLGMLLFPVEQPQYFDAVVTTGDDRVVEIQVKRNDATSQWIWGALKMPGTVFHELHALWCERERSDEFLGTLINGWLERGGEAIGVRSGTTYVDVGTLHGYRKAVHMLGEHSIGSPDPLKPAADKTCPQ